MTSKELAVVVVGLGIAGKVRVRDLQETSGSLQLKAVVSRRTVDLEGVASLTLDEAVTRSDVDAIIICTEPGTHEEYVEKSLQNGKHVLVEYPLAKSSEKAVQLYRLAQEKGLVLVEENIALLTESFETVQKKAATCELKSAEYSLIGRNNGWIENFSSSGLPFVTGSSGLETMIALFGDLKAVDGRLETTEDGYTAHAFLETKNKKPIHIQLSRMKEATRQKTTTYEFEDGEVIDGDKMVQRTGNKPGLFMKDMLNFHTAVCENRITEPEQNLTVRSLRLAEDIHAYFKTSS